MRTLTAFALLLSLLAAPARADEMAEAREHYKKGQVNYSLGEFKEAVTEFREAYRIRNEPGILFNVAQAYRQLGEWKQANFYYAQYLTKRPDASNRADVEQFMAAMKQKIDEQEAAERAKAEALAAKQREDLPMLTADAKNRGALGTATQNALGAAGGRNAQPTGTRVPDGATGSGPSPVVKTPTTRYAGYAALGAGAVAGGLAFVFKGSAQAAADELNRKYREGTLTVADAHLRTDAESKGKLATMSVIGAGVLVVTGAVLAFAF